jgi:hypothetical protein
MEDVQLGEFVKLCGDGMAKRGNHEPAQIGKRPKPRSPHGFQSMEVASDSRGKFPIEKSLFIGVEKGALRLPLGNKIQASGGFAVCRGPAEINLPIDWENTGGVKKALGGAVPTGIAGPWELDPAVEVLLGQQLTGAHLANGTGSSADQGFGNPSLAHWNVQIIGPPIAETAPMQAGQAVEVGEVHKRAD